MEDLPEEFATALAAYERHLVSERDLTPHTVRAYLGDVAGMLAHATALGLTALDQLDLRTLRSWLANQQTRGKARTTMARRATTASTTPRSFSPTGRICPRRAARGSRSAAQDRSRWRRP